MANLRPASIKLDRQALAPSRAAWWTPTVICPFGPGAPTSPWDRLLTLLTGWLSIKW